MLAYLPYVVFVVCVLTAQAEHPATLEGEQQQSRHQDTSDQAGNNERIPEEVLDQRLTDETFNHPEEIQPLEEEQLKDQEIGPDETEDASQSGPGEADELLELNDVTADDLVLEDVLEDDDGEVVIMSESIEAMSSQESDTMQGEAESAIESMSEEAVRVGDSEKYLVPEDAVHEEVSSHDSASSENDDQLMEEDNVERSIQGEPEVKSDDGDLAADVETATDHVINTIEQEVTRETKARKPNIVIILADDLGMGDVGCFGNDTIRTPNIDRIARQGAKLTHSIAAASVCTPSRAAILTGRYPIRMGMVPTNIVRVNMFISATGGLPSSEITFAELAKKQGYATALIGKWHLGVHCGEKDFCHHPRKQGFDYFYGLPLTNLKDFGGDGQTVTKSKVPYIDEILVVSCILGILTALLLRKILGLIFTILLMLLSITVPLLVYVTYRNLTLIDSVLMRNYDVIEQPVRFNNRLAARMADEGAKFIERQNEQDKPFLLFMSWVQVHTALHTAPEFTGVSNHGKYGDTVEEMDWTVGVILDALERARLKDDTFVYFTSDNGGHIEETGIDGDRQGGWNGIYRGGKMQGGMDGGIRVPTAVMYPGVIPAGRVIDHPTSLMDILPTVAKLLGVPLPSDRVIDGTDIGPLLAGDSDNRPHEFLFHYCGNDIHAARYTPDDDSGDVWKVHYVTPRWLPGTQRCKFVCDCYGGSVERHDPPLLYNIGTDPAEKELLDVTESKYKTIVEKIKTAVNSHTSSVQKVPNEMSVFKLLPWPSLQPCCGGSFPKCDCEEPGT